MDHQMVNCKITKVLWSSAVGSFDCCWVFPKSLQELLQAWKAPVGAPRGKELWKLSFLAVLWAIWKERNSRYLEGVGTSVSHLVEKAKFLVALWVSIPFLRLLKDIL